MAAYPDERPLYLSQRWKDDRPRCYHYGARFGATEIYGVWAYNPILLLLLSEPGAYNANKTETE
jgi:hypothetical protein